MGEAAPLPTVVHVGPDAEGGGGMAAVTRSLLASPLADRYRLIALTSHREGSALARAAVFAGALRRLLALARTTRGPLLLHVHATVRGSLHRKALVVACGRRARLPVLLHLHAGAGDLERFHGRLDPLRRRWFAHTLRSADAVVSVSRASARVLEARFGAPSVTVVDNPLPGPLPALAPAPADDGAEPQLLYLGGFANPVKGGAELLAALPGARARCPQARLLLAGPGQPPATLGDGAEWIGWLDEAAKRAALQRAAVFVLPSTSEGLPMALLEAMANAKAVVATRVGAVPDVIADGRDGLLVPPGDPAALGAALGALAADPARCAALGAAARRRAADFAPERVADRFDALYRDLLRARRGTS